MADPLHRREDEPDGLTAWLLEEDNPSVRYRTLVDLLGRATDAPEPAAAQQAIASYRPVRRMLEAQWPDGYWMHPDVGYSPKHKATVWQLIFLSQVGLRRCPAVEQAVEHLMGNALLTDGTVPGTDVPEARFTARNGESLPLLCLNGNLLGALLRFGYGSDTRVQAIRAALLAQVQRDGYRCRFNAPATSGRRPVHVADGLPCAWGAIKVMGAYLAIAEVDRTEAEQDAIEIGARFLLSHDLARADLSSSGGASPRWFRFGFPLTYSADLLELLEVIGRAGRGSQAILEPLVELVLAKRDVQGRWPLEWQPSNMWSTFGRIGRPNKWVTLRAALALRRVGVQAW